MVTKSYPGRRDLSNIAVKCEFSQGSKNQVINVMDSVVVQCNHLTQGLTCESPIRGGKCEKLVTTFHAPMES